MDRQEEHGRTRRFVIYAVAASLMACMIVIALIGRDPNSSVPALDASRETTDPTNGRGPYEIEVQLGPQMLDGGCMKIMGFGATRKGVDYYLVIAPEIGGLEVWDAERASLPRKERGWYFPGGRPAADEFTVCVPQP